MSGVKVKAMVIYNATAHFWLLVQAAKVKWALMGL